MRLSKRGWNSNETSASHGICGRGLGCRLEQGATASITTCFDSSHHSLLVQCMRVGERVTLQSSGTSSTTRIKNLGAGLREIGKSLNRFPATGQISRGRAIRTVPVFPCGPHSPTLMARYFISAIRSPLTEYRVSILYGFSILYIHPSAASHLPRKRSSPGRSPE